MLSKVKVLDILGTLESKKFHKNRNERSYTTSYGVYAHAWESSSIIRYVETVSKAYRINMNTVSGRRKMTRLTSNHITIKDEYEQHIYKFFIDNFTNASINDALGENANLSFFAFAVNAGMTNAIKALQRTVNTIPDGKFGKNSLHALFTATSHSTDEELSQLFNSYAFKYYKGLRLWGIYGKGWTRRLRYLGWRYRGMR